MDIYLTNEREIFVKLEDELDLLIPLSELVVIVNEFGFDKGFDYIIEPIFVFTSQDIKPSIIEELKKSLHELLKTKVSDLEKSYYIEKHKIGLKDKKND